MEFRKLFFRGALSGKQQTAAKMATALRQVLKAIEISFPGIAETTDPTEPSG